jgi:hypothetical protein
VPLAAPGTASLGGIAMPVQPLLENYDLPPAGSAVDVMVDHLKNWRVKSRSGWRKWSNNGCRRKMAELNNNDVQGQQDVALTPVEQAAIVLLSIGEEPAAAVLRCLEREELIELTQVMSRMSGIKVDAVKNAIQKFFDDYRQQSGLHKRLAQLPEALARPGAGQRNREQRAEHDLRRRDPPDDGAPAVRLAEVAGRLHRRRARADAGRVPGLPAARAGRPDHRRAAARGPRAGAAEPGAPGRDRPRPAGRAGRAGAALPVRARHPERQPWKACARLPRS